MLQDFGGSLGKHGNPLSNPTAGPLGGRPKQLSVVGADSGAVRQIDHITAEHHQRVLLAGPVFTGGTLKILNLGEAYYRVVRVDRRDEAESLWRVALRGTSVSVKDATRQRVRRAIEQVDARDCLCRRRRGRDSCGVQRDTAHRRSGNRASRG